MNTEIFYFFNNLANKSIAFDTLVVFLAGYLRYWMTLGIFMFFIFGKDKKREFKKLFLVAISAFLSRAVLTELIRFIYPHPRPFVDNQVYTLLSHETTSSLPSGDAAFFFALATAVYFFINKRWSAVFFIGAILISITRVIAGIHWPADILAGAVVGILSAWATNRLAKTYGKRMTSQVDNA